MTSSSSSTSKNLFCFIGPDAFRRFGKAKYSGQTAIVIPDALQAVVPRDDVVNAEVTLVDTGAPDGRLDAVAKMLIASGASLVMGVDVNGELSRYRSIEVANAA